MKLVSALFAVFTMLMSFLSLYGTFKAYNDRDVFALVFWGVLALYNLIVSLFVAEHI